MMLVQMCGLPGAGKSTLAAAVADVLQVVWLRVDAIEAAMWKYRIPPAQPGIAAYSVMHAVAGPRLRRGQIVLADAVSGVAAARAGWTAPADAHGAEMRIIEVVCPDVAEHRRRVEGRDDDLPDFPLPPGSRSPGPWPSTGLVTRSASSSTARGPSPTRCPTSWPSSAWTARRRGAANKRAGIPIA